MRNIVMRFDMRTSAQCVDSPKDRYQALIAMGEWADQHKVDVIGLSEHHNSPDGYLSAPIPVASAIAARTERIRISISALLVPLHDPVRLAEDLAALDLIANGRFIATAGLGYRQTEYAMFDAEWERRGKVFDEKLTVMLQAFSGEPFEYRGETVQLNPVPESPPHMLMMVGGNSKAAAKRAARFGLMFGPAIDDPKLAQVYYEECKQHDVPIPYVIFPQAPSTTLLSHDPDKAWEDYGEYLLFDALAYGKWKHKNRRAYAESFAQDMNELREEGKYRILTPEQAIETIKQTGSLHLTPLVGGLPIKAGWETLTLYEEKVEPFIE